MISFIDFLQAFGEQLLDHLWFPLLVWTVIALPLIVFLRWKESISPFYQYHSRLALALTLPMGIAGSWFVQWINSGTTSAGKAAFIIVQKPLIISSTQQAEGTASIGFSSPMLWLGMLSLILFAGAAYFLMRTATNYWSLKNLENDLNFTPLADCEELLNSVATSNSSAQKTLLAFSDDATVPYTYGWRKTKIVIPADLKDNADALSMAVQHELMHIKYHDFMVNGLMTLVKSLFWFHPLVHHLHTSAQEYREITCDGEVLATNTFSRKKYASLLFELAKRDHQSNMAMSMAVNPSSLKKRIKIMSNYSTNSGTFRSSIMLTLASAALIVLTISCTDMSENGITNTELEEAQTQMSSKTMEMNEPLYVINGEQWDKNDPEKQKILSGLKPKYIKSINVLKGEKATSEYGSTGKNGVIEMTVNNPEKAFSDLETESEKQSNSPDEDYFVTVEEMPQLKGGLSSIMQKIDYPEEAHKAGVEGRVIVQFIVNEEGNVEDPQIIKGIGHGADKEALRVVKTAQFEPGMQRGKPVRVQYSLPVVFRLSSDNGQS